jgi:hypothetical protein
LINLATAPTGLGGGNTFEVALAEKPVAQTTKDAKTVV